MLGLTIHNLEERLPRKITNIKNEHPTEWQTFFWERGISNRIVAEMMGVSTMVVWRWLSGKANPPASRKDQLNEIMSTISSWEKVHGVKFSLGCFKVEEK